MSTNITKYLTLAAMMTVVVLFSAPLSYAQTAAEEAREQREAELERRQEELRELRDLEDTEKPQTAEEVLDMLKKRVEEKRAERRRKELMRVSGSIGVTQIWETNPTSTNAGAKDDPSLEKTLNLNWLPKFTKSLSGNLGFSLTDLRYNDHNPTLGTFDNTLSYDLTYRTLQGKLSLTPGGSYQWMDYPKAHTSSYEQKKTFLRWTYYWTPEWNIGGKYEHAQKKYQDALARTEAEAEIPGLKREEFRNTVELWVKRFIGRYNVKLKAKSYINTGNDEFQDFYDYSAHKGEVTLAGSFLKDNKLYTSYTADFEKKNYVDRIAVTNARSDRLHTHRLTLKYSVTKDISVSYTFTYKQASSNTLNGEYENFSNKIGMTYSF